MRTMLSTAHLSSSMLTPTRAAMGGLLLFSIALVSACAGAGTGGEPDGGGITGCVTHSECGDGYVCAGGSCVVGECVAAVQPLCGTADADPDEVVPYCCKAWQSCNFDRTCVNSPDFVGSQCEVDADCPNIGQFCSGANCYDAAGRTPCTANFQCAADERCDRDIALCVPDLGGCNFCSDTFPELCCEEGAVCDTETRFCIDIAGAQCTVATEAIDCLPNQHCDPYGRCVQCETDDECGPGTLCNVGTGKCYSESLYCEDDDDCNGSAVCTPDNQCILAECTSDAACQVADPRRLCDLTSYTCYFPPAVCTETDEPNDTIDSATLIPLTGASGTLCRGNTDVLGFPIEGDKRYRVTVEFPSFNVGGVSIALLRPNGALVDTDTFATFEKKLTIVGITGETDTGNLYLRIVGNGTGADQWAYTVSITVTDAPNAITCEDEDALGIEPNGTFQTAYALALGSHTFARCSNSDEDYYHVVLPPQSGIEVISEHEQSEGDLELELFSAPNQASRIAFQDTTSGIERVEGPEAAEYWVRVALWTTTATGIPGQNYTLTVNAVGRPAACANDPGEPDDESAATAPPLALDTTTPGMRCIPADVDHRTLVVPGGMSGAIGLTFTHSQGDLRLELLNSAGTVVVSSNTSSNVNGLEAIEIPVFATEQTYVVRVRLNGGTGIVAQPYALEASLYDATVCLASEPVSNATLLTGRCIGDAGASTPCSGSSLPSPLVSPGDFAPCDDAPETPGCATVCGAADADYYRVGKLTSGQLLIARLRYDTSTNRRLGLALVRANADFSAETWVAYDPDTSSTGEVLLTTVAPTVPAAFEREYGVLVRAESQLTYPALPYVLDVTVGAPCFADAREPNQTAGTSALVRTDGAPGVDYTADLDGTLCVGDVDVVELIAFSGETVRVTLLAPTGLALTLGTRPADLSGLPDPLASATVVDGPCPVPTPPSGGPTAPVCLQATTTVTQGFQQLYATIERATDDLVTTTEPYVLRIEALTE
jgi:hypothetical protein